MVAPPCSEAFCLSGPNRVVSQPCRLLETGEWYSSMTYAVCNSLLFSTFPFAAWVDDANSSLPRKKMPQEAFPHGLKVQLSLLSTCEIASISPRAQRNRTSLDSIIYERIAVQKGYLIND